MAEIGSLQNDKVQKERVNEISVSTTGEESSTRKRSRGILGKYAIVIAWLAEIAIFALVDRSSFFSLTNFKEIASSQADLAILSLSVVPTLAVGEIDLSVASVMALSATIFGEMNGIGKDSIWLSLLVALAASVATGLVSGIITVMLRVKGIVVTLGMGTLVLGIALEVSHSLTVTGISSAFQGAMNRPLGGISYTFYYALIITVILWYVFRHTPAGRHMLFLGFNREVARLSGIEVSRLRVVSFLIGSFIAGLAGIIAIGVAGGADPSSFQPELLPAFAAVFLGSLILTPGRINAFGTLIALYFLATGIVGIQLLGAGSWIDDAFYGAALVVTVALSGLAEILGLRVRREVKAR